MRAPAVLAVVSLAACHAEPRAEVPRDRLTVPSRVEQPPFAPVGAPLAARPAAEPIVAVQDPAVALSLHDTATCAVLGSGAVACWGIPFGAPQRISGWTDVTKIALSSELLCALHRDGHVDCGRSDEPDLERDDAQISPLRLDGVVDAVDLQAAYGAMCALERGGTIACWAAGGPPRAMRAHVRGATALRVGMLAETDGVTQPAVSFACAWTEHRVVCFDVFRQQDQPAGPRPWPGTRYLAAAGSAPRLELGEPRAVAALADVTAPLEPTDDHVVCARLASGAPRCVWLDLDLKAQVVRDADAEPRCTRRGLEATCRFSTTSPYRPTITVTLPRVRQLFAGDTHACALLDRGEVACWGSDAYGQLGRSPREGVNLRPVHGLHDALEVVHRPFGVIALRANGQLAYWGDGEEGGPPEADVPVTFSQLTDARHLVAGQRHACVLRRSGKVACWGSDEDSAFRSGVPVDVPGLDAVTQLRATDYGLVARVADGRLLHLGDLQLGRSASMTPAPIATAERAASVVVAGQWVCVLDRRPGGVRCWAETGPWTTPTLELAEVDADVREIAGVGPPMVIRAPEVLADNDPWDSYPHARLVLWLVDDRAIAVDLSIAHARPVATLTALASDVRGVFTSGGRACARGANGVACVTLEFDSLGAPVEVPPDHAGATSMIVGSPTCVVEPSHRVVCFDRSPFVNGIGAQSFVPVQVVP